MIVYKDKFTGKTYTVNKNTVTDEFGNVATITGVEWVEMQGDDVEIVGGVNVDNLSFFVTYKERETACKALAKAFGITWSWFTSRYDSSQRLVLLCKAAGVK